MRHPMSVMTASRALIPGILAAADAAALKALADLQKRPPPK